MDVGGCLSARIYDLTMFFPKPRLFFTSGQHSRNGGKSLMTSSNIIDCFYLYTKLSLPAAATTNYLIVALRRTYLTWPMERCDKDITIGYFVLLAKRSLELS